ncbi:SyrB-like regulator [Ensifer sp. SL37]|uniref:SyrB-like regulator n=1 Tax=Ensifer sp. SL37 TaxID=2995137 RepID=UPI002275C47A|nr:SyrB-like regulator [Ensifer sp. SL37]MCY1740778.1 SyrB-like regulator [Ensifer sp. SL37]
MTDENKIEIEAEIASPKKRRAPRSKKVGSDVTTDAPKTGPARAPRGSRKSATMPADGVAPVKTVGKPTPKNATKVAGRVRATKEAAEVAAAFSDEISDLLELEEENARLRKTLAEKLRAENADLRKRLGLA